jgi:hypothetical protein
MAFLVYKNAWGVAFSSLLSFCLLFLFESDAMLAPLEDT